MTTRKTNDTRILRMSPFCIVSVPNTPGPRRTRTPKSWRNHHPDTRQIPWSVHCLSQARGWPRQRWRVLHGITRCIRSPLASRADISTVAVAAAFGGHRYKEQQYPIYALFLGEGGAHIASGAVAIAFRLVACIGLQSVADVTPINLLPNNAEARLVRRPRDQE